MQTPRLGLFNKSWIVFVHAILISFESIGIEALTVRTGISPLDLAAIAIPIAGGILALIARWKLKGSDQLIAVFRSWKHLSASGALLAVGLFTWYDSIDRVGAAKEGLLAGPVETVFILFLARIFLGERLKRIQVLGVCIAIAGFFLTVASGGSSPAQLSIGDIEAIISAGSFGAGIIVITKMTERHGSMAVTSGILIVSGLLLLAATIPVSGAIRVGQDIFSPIRMESILLFSLLPLTAALSYVVGLARIGASLTSTIASFSILIVVLVQLGQRALGYMVILPENALLAVGGGMLAVLGICLIHASPRNEKDPNGRVTTRPPI